MEYSIDRIGEGWGALQFLDDVTSQISDCKLKSGVQLGLFDLLLFCLGKLVVKGGG